jgi:hypothetical protein
MSGMRSDLLEQDPTRFRPVVARFIAKHLDGAGRPSARELLRTIEQRICLDARWAFRDAVEDCSRDHALRAADRAYFASMIDAGSIDEALRGEGAAEEEAVSTIDALLRQSAVYRSSAAFREMIAFMGRFRNY